MKQIPLTQGRVAFVDDEDYVRLMTFSWCARRMGNQWYSTRSTWDPITKRRGKIAMHRELMGFPRGIVDHKNRNGLDNRKENLRPANKSQNACNSSRATLSKSGYRGVYYYRRGNPKKWNARIMVNYREISLGYFATPEEAARAYNAAAREHHGEFSNLNNVGEK